MRDLLWCGYGRGVARTNKALGTSYVNELDSQRALHNLKAWVQHNPKYAGLEITVDEYSDGTLMDEVGGSISRSVRE